jgi:gliding motility-associated-like protein
VKIFLTYCVFLLSFLGFGQEVWMYPNRGQWQENIKYSIDLQLGKMYIENKGMTFFLTDIMQHDHDHAHSNDGTVRYHAIHQFLVNAEVPDEILEFGYAPHLHHYILGNNASKWKSDVRGVKMLDLKSIYPGINQQYESKNGQLHYHFDVSPDANPQQIKFRIEGATQMRLDPDGSLVLAHRFGEIRQSAPVAWNELENGTRSYKSCRFKIVGNEVSFDFPEGYDAQERLIIDPSLTFSTFSGATSDNWGFTATPDVNGNLFGGGIVFGSGYPTTPGAYDVSFGGGTGSFPMDVTISKYNTTGTSLMYSTFIGGSGNETPHSIVAAPNGELYIYGVTSSSNFPMAGTPYDNSFNGGPSVTENSLNFNGSDIFIARLSAAGNALLSSTYVGGSGTDGLNISTLNYNYGDQFRGEIILDNQQNVYVASTTVSGNFPTTNATQGTLMGSQDAVIFKLNPNLSTMLWSTFFGGTGVETGNSVTISNDGTVYVAGGTSSTNLPVTGGHGTTFSGGISDGYVLRINGNSGAFLSGSYIGSNRYDQAYFVQTDPDNFVYVYGQTATPFPISPGRYGTNNSGQFIRKYTSNLINVVWTTSIGAGTGNPEISPTAFLVSDCYDIYIAGWGGQLNAGGQASFSSTNGFQITADAFQTVTNGSNFYVAVLAPDAAQLKYASFMGGMTSSSNHVDGGTSRFDKAGRIYHAVCGACGGNPTGFTSTPGSWSPTNPSNNCNMATFKFELNTIDAVLPQPQNGCAPFTVQFQNNSTNGNAYLWDFGDGNTSTAQYPTHTYTNPGNYSVRLRVSDSFGCFTPDSAFVTIRVGGFTPGANQNVGAVCSGESVQLSASGGTTYLWSPAEFLSNPNIANPIATVTTTTTFNVTVTDSCGTTTLPVIVPVFTNSMDISPDTSICLGNSVSLYANTSGNVTWTPPVYLDNPSSPTPTSTPESTITYLAISTTDQGCTVSDSVRISVYFDLPNTNLPDSTEMCRGSQVGLLAYGGSAYQWYPEEFMNNSNQALVVVYPPDDKWYFVDVTNACGTVTDSIFVDVTQANILAGNDTTICSGETANLWASGASYYLWHPMNSVVSQTPTAVRVKPSTSTTYMVEGVDEIGCRDTAYVEVVVIPQPSLSVTPTIYAFYDDEVQLEAITNTSGNFVWTPSEGLSCVNCPNPIATPNQNTTYYVYFIDNNGCRNSSYISIKYDVVIYVPNTFIPNGDGVNDYFRVYGGNILDMECFIYNRWGELIKVLRSKDEFWDGTYKGNKCQDGTYVWKLVYQDFAKTKHVLTGHVNLLR